MAAIGWRRSRDRRGLLGSLIGFRRWQTGWLPSASAEPDVENMRRVLPPNVPWACRREIGVDEVARMWPWADLSPFGRSAGRARGGWLMMPIRPAGRSCAAPGGAYAAGGRAPRSNRPLTTDPGWTGSRTAGRHESRPAPSSSPPARGPGPLLLQYGVAFETSPVVRSRSS